MLSYEVKFLTSDDSVYLKNGDFKSFKYETKKKVDESVYDAGKRSYCERRGGQWRAPRPRQLRQLESKLRDRSIIFSDWTSATLITIVFSSGAIAYLTVKPETLDVTQILFDRFCIGKLSSQAITSVVLSKSHLLFIQTDRTATLISFGKATSNQPCRIKDRDPHIQCIELGSGARRAERHVSSFENASGVRVLLWTATSAEPAPWSPAVEDLANLHIYQIQGQQVLFVAYHQLENDTLSAGLSHKSESVVHIIEQLASQKTGVTLQWLRYDIPADDRTIKLSSLRESLTTATLPAPARVVRRSPCDARVLVACIDGSLHVVHCVAGLTHSVRAGFIATDVRWAGDLVLAAEEAGRLQCFDKALSLLHHHTKCLDFTSYLRDSRRLELLTSSNVRGGTLILASFSGGPLALLRITHPRLITAWIRAGRVPNAVSLLKALDWDSEGMEGLWAVNKIVCHVLRSGLQEGGSAMAQAALGAYLAPAAPHSPTGRRLAPAVHDLARKFFHHLLRRGRVDVALSLGVDLRARDLFADARWAALRLRRPALAEEAAALADHYAACNTGSECSDSCSQCSSHTCSDSEGDTSASSEAVKTKPPPLPRVAIPQNPTIMPVPITLAEPVSTNSIRPNLHQYLDRDNTIWNTNVKDDFHIKPILNNQNSKWHSVDNILGNYKLSGPSKQRSYLDMMPRHEDRLSNNFRHLFQSELREEMPNTLYRYQNSNYPSTSVGLESDRPMLRTVERNKVKFSDTVTIAVVPESRPATCPSPARELADSLPLCAPHKYLSAFAPLPPPAAPTPAEPAGTNDYVEV